MALLLHQAALLLQILLLVLHQLPQVLLLLLHTTHTQLCFAYTGLLMILCSHRSSTVCTALPTLYSVHNSLKIALCKKRKKKDEKNI